MRPAVTPMIALAALACGSRAGAPAEEPSRPRVAPVSRAAAGPAAPDLRAPAPGAATVGIEPPAPPSPRVDAAPPALADLGHGFIASTTFGTWIQPKPRSGALPLGMLRPGDALPLVEGQTVRGGGQCAEFVQVALGWVCASRRATRKVDSAFLRASRLVAPRPGPYPYEYALSLGAPMLSRLPADPSRWVTGSRELRKMRGWAAGHDELAEDELIEATGPVPDLLRDGGSLPTPWNERPHEFVKKIPRGSMLAYTHAFEHAGETWVLSTNLTVVPARGLKRFRRSAFRGVELGGGVELPLAWMRKEPRAKWALEGEAARATGEAWPLRGWVALTGTARTIGRERFLETREAGRWIRASDATVVEGAPRPPREVKGDGQWMHVRVLRGTLTLYEGSRPLFTTLMSPGKEGATPYGRYWIESKHHVTTMTTEAGEPRKFWIADVPWTIYFERPYAIHAAYWHEDFGEKKSGGCLNLSPLDARRVFDWAAPGLPSGWISVQAYTMGAKVFVLVEA
ncbi:MAG: L,D-transpeptidase family protein [Polyangiaceae bacterium]|nr:L,D-transpeptidase family protein [Polyangiaceae bacterium]